MNNEDVEELEATYGELSKALKAVTSHYTCDYCGLDFETETKAAFHVVTRHIR